MKQLKNKTNKEIVYGRAASLLGDRIVLRGLITFHEPNIYLFIKMVFSGTCGTFKAS